MLCFQCCAENSEANEVCRLCGAPFKIVCTACSWSNHHESHFCARCGASLAGAKDKAGPSPELLLRSLSVTGGELKRVTMLFADLGNSTSLIGGLDPEA